MGCSCFSTYIFKGEPSNIHKFYSDLLKANNGDLKFINIGLADIFKVNGDYVRPEWDYSLGKAVGTTAYGDITDIIYEEGSGEIEIRSTDSYHPQEDFVKYVKEKYNLSCLFYGEDEYGDVYSNDIDRTYFDEFYRLEIIPMYDTLDDLKEGLIQEGISEQDVELIEKWVIALDDIVENPMYFNYEEERDAFLEERGISFADYVRLASLGSDYILCEYNEVTFMEV